MCMATASTINPERRFNFIAVILAVNRATIRDDRHAHPGALLQGTTEFALTRYGQRGSIGPAT